MATIRNYKDSDYADVKRNLEEAKLFVPVWDTRERLEEKIRRNPDSIIVAEDKEKVIGNLFLVEDGWGAFIFHLAVHSSYKQKGIGKSIGQKLMIYAEESLKRKGAKAVFGFVEERNERAGNFYKRCGHIPLEKYMGMYKLL